MQTDDMSTSHNTPNGNQESPLGKPQQLQIQNSFGQQRINSLPNILNKVSPTKDKNKRNSLFKIQQSFGIKQDYLQNNNKEVLQKWGENIMNENSSIQLDKNNEYSGKDKMLQQASQQLKLKSMRNRKSKKDLFPEQIMQAQQRQPNNSIIDDSNNNSVEYNSSVQVLQSPLKNYNSSLQQLQQLSQQQKQSQQQQQQQQQSQSYMDPIKIRNQNEKKYQLVNKISKMYVGNNNSVSDLNSSVESDNDNFAQSYDMYSKNKLLQNQQKRSSLQVNSLNFNSLKQNQNQTQSQQQTPHGNSKSSSQLLKDIVKSQKSGFAQNSSQQDNNYFSKKNDSEQQLSHSNIMDRLDKRSEKFLKNNDSFMSQRANGNTQNKISQQLQQQKLQSLQQQPMSAQLNLDQQQSSIQKRKKKSTKQLNIYYNTEPCEEEDNEVLSPIDQQKLMPSQQLAAIQKIKSMQNIGTLLKLQKIKQQDLEKLNQNNDDDYREDNTQSQNELDSNKKQRKTPPNQMQSMQNLQNQNGSSPLKPLKGCLKKRDFSSDTKDGGNYGNSGQKSISQFNSGRKKSVFFTGKMKIIDPKSGEEKIMNLKDNQKKQKMQKSFYGRKLFASQK